MAALARVERTDFLHPMLIGEVAHVSAELTYTSRHSVEVQVNVMAENILTGGHGPALPLSVKLASIYYSLQTNHSN